MKVTVSVGLDHDFVVKMRKLAHTHEMSISSLCGQAIIDYVEKLENPQKVPANPARNPKGKAA